ERALLVQEAGYKIPEQARQTSPELIRPSDIATKEARSRKSDHSVTKTQESLVASRKAAARGKSKDFTVLTMAHIQSRCPLRAEEGATDAETLEKGSTPPRTPRLDVLLSISEIHLLMQ
ncbi:MAG: hypothetical protein Q9174_005943, partial [Haloplaca sp. 1 TL-2023]